jgi:hypothetical protein
MPSGRSRRVEATPGCGAYAAGQIGSAGIADNSVRSVDIKDGTLSLKDLRPHAVTRLQRKAVTQALQDRVAQLEADAADGSDINTNWTPGPGATIESPNSVELNASDTPDDPSTPWDDSHTSFASIKNLDLPVQSEAVIEFTYKLDNGAAAHLGSPRIQIRINGVTYSSAHQVTPDNGNDNGDGTFTVQAVATSLHDNSAHKNPEGTITRASLVYDNQPAPGTVTFTHVVIDGQPISFQ